VSAKIPNYETPCTHEANDSQRLRPNHAMLLCMLSVCMRSYLNSVKRYKFLILDISHPDIPRLREDMMMRESVVIFRSQKVSASRKVWEAVLQIKTAASPLLSNSSHSFCRFSTVSPPDALFYVTCK
jgi:hypothetical protein